MHFGGDILYLISVFVSLGNEEVIMTRWIRNFIVVVASIGMCSMAVAAEGDHFVKAPGTVLTKAQLLNDWDEYLSHWGQRDPYNVLLPVATHTYLYTNIPGEFAGHVPEEEVRTAKAKSGYSAASLAAIQQYFGYPIQYKSATKECQLVQSEEEVDYMTFAFGPRVAVSSIPLSLSIQGGVYNWNTLNNDTVALVTGNSAVLLGTKFGKEFSSAAPEAFATALQKDLDYAHGYYVACPVDAKAAFLEKAIYAPLWSGQPVAVALKNELGETCSVLAVAVAYNATTKKYSCYLQWGDENHYDDLNGWYDLTSPLTIEMTEYIAIATIPFYPKEITHTWTLVGATTLIAPPAEKTAVKPSGDTIIPVVGRIVDEKKTFKSLEGFTVSTGLSSTTTTADGFFSLTAPANKTLTVTVKDKKSNVVGTVTVITGAFPQSHIADFKTTLDALVPAIQEIPVEAAPIVEATYTITFNANGGEGGKTVTQAAEVALTAPTVTREGYDFVRWEPAVPAKTPAANTTYTAQWQVKQYTMTFNANGGVGGKTMTQNYGSTLTPPNVTREGYTFKNWYPEVPAKVPAANITYTAQWQQNVVDKPDVEDKPVVVKYTIIFDANGGEGGKEDLLVAGSTLKAPVVTREGYTFMGWSPVVPTVSPAADITYTAQWQETKVDVALLITTPVNKKGETTITGVNGTITHWLDIPETLNGAKVVAIADGAFKGQAGLTKVTLPNTITSIGKDAFRDCAKLDVNSVIMPNQSKLKLGKGAFMGCKVVEVAAVPGEPLTSQQFGKAVGYKVATSVSGLKLNAKTGDITATFKKSGTYEAVLFKPGATLKVLRIKVGAMPKLTIKMEDADAGCSVKGAGEYLMGKKVSLSAKASKEKIFLGFYDAQGKQLTSAMKYSHVMGREDVTLTAKFTVEQITIDTSALTSKTWQVGETVNVTIPVTAESGVKSVKAAKLPSGLKLSKTKDNRWQVTGSPKKEGNYTVTFTAGTTQKKQKVESFTMNVLEECTSLDLADVAAATFNVSQSVSNIVIGASATSEIKSIKASKLPSGMKVQCINGVWQLTGTPKKAGTYNVTITMTTKAGTKVTETLMLTVNLVPEWAAKKFNGTVTNYWDDDGNWEEISGSAAVTIFSTGEVEGSIYLEDGARALLSGAAKLLESSANKVCLQIVVPWFDSDDKADGKVKTELVIENRNGDITLNYRDSAKGSYVNGTLEVMK